MLIDVVHLPSHGISGWYCWGHEAVHSCQQTAWINQHTQQGHCQGNNTGASSTPQEHLQQL
jgi:hypothetical protein